MTVDTVLDMTDAKDFTVAVKDNTVKFTATDGKVAALGLEKTSIVYNKATKINLVQLDSKNVELGTVACSNIADTDGKTNVEYKIDVTSDAGYFTGDGLVLTKVGNTAKVTATKHSGVYKDGKEDGNISFEGTITAVESANLSTDVKWTLTNAAPYDWSKVTENHDLIVEETANFFMNVKDTDGKDVIKGDPTTAANGQYTIVSMNKDILFVDGNKLTPNKAGTAVININDVNGKTVYSYSINVKEAAKPVSFTVDTPNVTVSNSTYAAATAAVTVTVMDQYGRKTNKNASVAATLTASPAAAAGQSDPLTAFGGVGADGKASTVFAGTDSGNSNAKGTYTYKITLTDTNLSKVVYTAVVNAKIEEPTGTRVDYALLLDGKNAAASVDAAVTIDTLAPKAVKIQVGKFRNGVLDGYYNVSDAVISMTDKDNKQVATSTAVAGERDALTSNAPAFNFYVRTSQAVANAYEQAAVGTYTVTVKVPSATGTGLKNIKQYINVTNSQDKVVMAKRSETETVNATSMGASDTTKGAILAAFEFSYGNTALTGVKNNAIISNADPEKNEIDESSIVSYETTNVTTLTGGVHRVFVKSVTVKVPVTVSNATTHQVVYVTQKVAANYYLQFK